MGRRVTLLAALLLLVVGGVPAAASDEGDVRCLRRLLEQRDEPPRPKLGLLDARTGGSRPSEALDPDPDERPEREQDDDDDTAPVDEVMDWLDRVGGPRDHLAEDLLRRVAVDVEVRLPGDRVERGRLVARPGRRAMLARTRCVRIVGSYAAELACDNSGGLRPSAVGDPIPDSLREGLVVDVRSFVVGGGTHVALEVALQAGRFDHPVERIDTEARFLGNLDLPRYRGALLFASGTTAVGEPLDMALQSPSGETIDLRLTPHVLEVAERDRDSERARTVHRLDAGLLVVPSMAAGFTHGPQAWSNPRRQILPDLGWREPNMHSGTAWQLVLDMLPEAPWLLLEDGGVWLQAPDPAVARLREALDAWTARAARTVRVEITARAGDTVVGRASVTAHPGRGAFFRLGTDRAVILDWSTVVG